jgi:hypothetical protein
MARTKGAARKRVKASAKNDDGAFLHMHLPLIVCSRFANLILCYVPEQWWICATQARTSPSLPRLLRGLLAAITTVVPVPPVLLLLLPPHMGLRCQRFSRPLLAPLLHSCSKHSCRLKLCGTPAHSKHTHSTLHSSKRSSKRSSGLSCKPSNNKLSSKRPTRLCALLRHSSRSSRSSRLHRYGLPQLHKQQQQQGQEQLQRQRAASGIGLTSLAAAALMVREKRERARRRR